MFFFSPRALLKVFANGAVVYVVLFFILVWLLLLNACSGNSMPGSTSTGTTTTTPTNPTASLTISSSLPSATVESSYNATVTVTGGTVPYTFALASGTLPQGLELGDNTGTISGTPSASGNASFTISVSDSAGLSRQQALQIAVANAPSPAPSPTPAPAPSQGQSFSSLQHSGGWSSSGQRAPNYVDCSPSPCNGITFWMGQGISSPSLSGQASGYSVGGTVSFSDAIFVNHLIGPGSSQGLPDPNQTMVPSLHDFTYDVYFYGGDFGVTQALEFDINQFFNNLGFIFGHECRLAGGNEWDVWDNQNKHWTPTGIPCYPNQNSWNHLTIKVQRNSNNELVYQSITLNGQSNTLNWTFPAGTSPGWYGITVNYQMDGDSKQNPYTIYLDNLTFSYQ